MRGINKTSTDPARNRPSLNSASRLAHFAADSGFRTGLRGLYPGRAAGGAGWGGLCYRTPWATRATSAALRLALSLLRFC